MSGNFAIKGGGGGPLMANAILNFHFDYVTTSLITIILIYKYEKKYITYLNVASFGD